MVKEFHNIKLPNKDYAVIIKVNNTVFYLTYSFNSISGTYTGLKISSFTNSIRGLLREIPDFFEKLNEVKYVDSLKKMGFELTEPTPEQRNWFNIMYNCI